jgi:hypothetical protein
MCVSRQLLQKGLSINPIWKKCTVTAYSIFVINFDDSTRVVTGCSCILWVDFQCLLRKCSWSRHYATHQKVTSLISNEVTVSFNSPTPGTGQPAGAYGWRHGHLWAECLENVQSSTFHNPMGHHGLLQGQLSLYLYCEILNIMHYRRNLENLLTQKLVFKIFCHLFSRSWNQLPYFTYNYDFEWCKFKLCDFMDSLSALTTD